MGFHGLELHKKRRGTSSRWEKVTLPDNLPAVNLSDRPPLPMSASPPPGRPRFNSKRGRQTDSDSDTEQTQSKVAKQSAVSNLTSDKVKPSAKTFSELVEEANLVSDGPVSPVDSSRKIDDTGNLTSIEGSIGTPYKILAANVTVHSPIFTSKSQPSMQ